MSYKSFLLPKIVSLFELIFLEISKFLQMLGLQPQISKVFFDRYNFFFSQ